MNTTDPIDIEEARYVQELTKAAEYADMLDSVTSLMYCDIIKSLQGDTGGVQYARKLMGAKFICRRDPLEVLEQMLEGTEAGVAFFELMQQDAAKSFLDAFCKEYIARYAADVAEAGVTK